MSGNGQERRAGSDGATDVANDWPNDHVLIGASAVPIRIAPCSSAACSTCNTTCFMIGTASGYGPTEVHCRLAIIMSAELIAKMRGRIEQCRRLAKAITDPEA